MQKKDLIENGVENEKCVRGVFLVIQLNQTHGLLPSYLCFLFIIIIIVFNVLFVFLNLLI